LAFNAPAWKRIEGWRTYGITCGEIEARVMQRTSNRRSDHDALGERSAVMRALCADGEELFRATNQQYIVFSDTTGEDLSFRNRSHRDALGQISYRLGVAHIKLLTETL
jgi:hypothetical protein